MCVTFYKYHGSGSDYLVYDCTENKNTLSPENIRMICSTNFGLGSDGIMVGPVMKEDGIHVQIFNPDGSEAENNGSSISVFAGYLRDAGYVAEKEKSLVLHTPAGPVYISGSSENGSDITAVRSVGKMILTDEFIRNNQIGK